MGQTTLAQLMSAFYVYGMFDAQSDMLPFEGADCPLAQAGEVPPFAIRGA